MHWNSCMHVLFNCFIRVCDCFIEVYVSICKSLLDVLNLFQHDYCISNQDLQNVVRSEPYQPHLLSYTLLVTLRNDHKIFMYNK